MSIDFSKLDALRSTDADPVKRSTESDLYTNDINTPDKQKNALESVSGANTAKREVISIPQTLQKEQNVQTMARKLVEVHQEATKRTQKAQFDLLKGVQNHEDLKTLLLKAVKGFSAAICNELLYEQIEEEINKNY